MQIYLHLCTYAYIYAHMLTPIHQILYKLKSFSSSSKCLPNLVLLPLKLHYLKKKSIKIVVQQWGGGGAHPTLASLQQPISRVPSNNELAGSALNQTTSFVAVEVLHFIGLKIL